MRPVCLCSSDTLLCLSIGVRHPAPAIRQNLGPVQPTVPDQDSVFGNAVHKAYWELQRSQSARAQIHPRFPATQPQISNSPSTASAFHPPDA